MIRIETSARVDHAGLERETGWAIQLTTIEGAPSVVEVVTEGVTEPEVLAALDAHDPDATAREAARIQLARSAAEAAQRAGVVAIRALAAPLVRSGEISGEDLRRIAPLFPSWVVGEPVAVGDLRTFEGVIYEVVQAHTTQADWAPPDVPALFRPHRPPGAVTVWAQPLGAHDAFRAGDRVTHDGRLWESLVASNVWEPGAAGAGRLWEDLGPAPGG